MTKVFGEMKPGDKIYLVARDTRDGKIFKIRNLDVKYVENLGNGQVKIGYLMAELIAGYYSTSKCSPGSTKTYFKAFTTIEEAREDYKARLLAEISDLNSKISLLSYHLNSASSDLSRAMNYNKYNETKA